MNSRFQHSAIGYSRKHLAISIDIIRRARFNYVGNYVLEIPVMIAILRY